MSERVDASFAIDNEAWMRGLELARSFLNDIMNKEVPTPSAGDLEARTAERVEAKLEEHHALQDRIIEGYRDLTGETPPSVEVALETLIWAACAKRPD
jgi:hypothetical protein